MSGVSVYDDGSDGAEMAEKLTAAAKKVAGRFQSFGTAGNIRGVSPGGPRFLFCFCHVAIEQAFMQASDSLPAISPYSRRDAPMRSG
jgi:hypothetical protein